MWLQALQNAANDPGVALQAYTVPPDSQEEPGVAEAEAALAVRRCREEAVDHEKAAISIGQLNPRRDKGRGTAEDLMGMTDVGSFG